MSRRTKSEIEYLKNQLYDIVRQYRPMTVRQIFYQAVSRGLIPKTENEYGNTIVRLLGLMRKNGEMPFDWIADNTRWQRRPRTWEGLESMLEHSSEFYRRHLWGTTPVDVEIWLEKEALAGVMVGVTDEWDIPLCVTRGYPSLSYLHTAGDVIRGRTWPTYVYYFGDYDPSGVDIPRKVEAGLREYSNNAEIYFEVLAVTPEQIDDFDLPTRPTKKSDTRNKSFADDRSVEVDAIEPDMLREMVRDCIEQHVDWGKYQALRRTEQAERDTLKEIARRMPEFVNLDR